MVAFLKAQALSQSMQDLNERLGFAHFEMISEDEEISANPDNLATFVNDSNVILPKGEELLNIATWSKAKRSDDITGHVIATAEGALEGKVFSGEFNTKMNYLEIQQIIQLSGSFKIYLA